VRYSSRRPRRGDGIIVASVENPSGHVVGLIYKPPFRREVIGLRTDRHFVSASFPRTGTARLFARQHFFVDDDEDPVNRYPTMPERRR